MKKKRKQNKISCMVAKRYQGIGVSVIKLLITSNLTKKINVLKQCCSIGALCYVSV